MFEAGGFEGTVLNGSGLVEGALGDLGASGAAGRHGFNSFTLF